MARKRRSRRPDPRLSRMLPAEPGWRWRTLPVWLALTGGFVAGWYVAAIGGATSGGWSYVVLLIALAGFSLGLSRLVRWLVERRIVRRRARAAAAQPEPPRPGKRPQTPV